MRDAPFCKGAASQGCLCCLRAWSTSEKLRPDPLVLRVAPITDLALGSTGIKDHLAVQAISQPLEAYDTVQRQSVRLIVHRTPGAFGNKPAVTAKNLLGMCDREDWG